MFMFMFMFMFIYIHTFVSVYLHVFLFVYVYRFVNININNFLLGWSQTSPNFLNLAIPRDHTHRIHGTDIFTYIYLVFMVHLGKYTIHGSYRIFDVCSISEKRGGGHDVIFSSHLLAAELNSCKVQS